jgi:hypothetical protein
LKDQYKQAKKNTLRELLSDGRVRHGLLLIHNLTQLSNAVQSKALAWQTIPNREHTSKDTDEAHSQKSLLQQ